MPAPESVKKLIETFGNNLDFYKSTQYNKAQLETQLPATDRQIDRLVYKLYNLTEEEIALMEGTES